MIRIQTLAVCNVLSRCAERLAQHYGGKVSNGHICDACFARGFGTSEPHAENCPGVTALRDAREILAELEGRPS